MQQRDKIWRQPTSEEISSTALQTALIFWQEFQKWQHLTKQYVDSFQIQISSRLNS